MATGLFNLKQVNQAISQGAWSGYIAPKWVEYLVVAGGGGGGSRAGGGGGAGGLLTGVVSVAAGTSYTVTVGTGGAGGVDTSSAPTSGNNSVLGSISSAGGGYGSSGRSPGNSGGASGGSGGGGSYSATSYGQGTSGQGNAGSAGLVSTSGNYWIGGSGGGAGTVALNGVNNGTSSVAGYGGAGIASSISGSVVVYAGGGGGGCELNSAGTGGVGGGGSGGYAANGTAGGGNTGGGGGGGGITTYSGGNGGSGIVVVRYPGSIQFFTGGTLSYANGYMIHTFYSSGTLAPTTPTPYVTSYQISRSLRFNSADSAYLNRTPASASNRTTWTWSGWVKRSSFGTDQQLFSAGGSGAFQFLYQTSTDCLYIYDSVSSTTAVITTQVFRDPSAWYHVVLATDTTQPTASNRFKLYINGVQVTSFGTATYPAQNSTLSVNNTVNHSVGSWSGAGGGNFFSGYMTEVNFIDGQQLTPSSFGYTNPATGVWSPLAFVGTYGTNGFYLNFSDNSNTTAATLGKDYSGNGNNWTPNNFSVTAGSGNDSLVDSPTSYGTDTGVGGTVRGNYAILNPLTILPTGQALSITNGNLDYSGTTGWWGARSSIGMTSGKWYCEVTITGGSTPYNTVVGLTTSQAAASGIDFYPGLDAYGWGYFGSNGRKFNNGTSTAYGNNFGINVTVGIAFDADAGSLTFYESGTSQGVAFTGLTNGPYFFTFGEVGASGSFNFGQRPFAYTAPSGYKALCTQNLPTPTIGATSTTLAGKYFGVTLRTGGAPSGGTYTTTVDMSNGALLWDKARNQAQNNYLVDSNRGLTKFLQSNATTAESTQASWYTSFGNGTYSTGSTDWGSSVSLVDWIWAAGPNTTNTAGSITSTVSANTTSGFSVVTYTGTGANATVGHGLGVAPKMVIVRARSMTANWMVWQTTLSGAQYLTLETTNAVGSETTVWNGTTPSSTVISIGTNGATNFSGTTYVAYCFAEVAGYSKFGSYTGNGSADGPFVYTGFRPAYVMIKSSSNASNWTLLDSKRNTYNVVNSYLDAELANAEGTFTFLDFTSNGFKIRTSDTSVNGGDPRYYIYMAFAENPFKYSLAR